VNVFVPARTAGSCSIRPASSIPRRVAEFSAINSARDDQSARRRPQKSGLRRAVVVSSNSPCGCNPHPDHLFDELSPYHPYMNYGRSQDADGDGREKNARYKGRIETVIIFARPWFYGPNQPPPPIALFSE